MPSHCWLQTPHVYIRCTCVCCLSIDGLWNFIGHSLHGYSGFPSWYSTACASLSDSRPSANSKTTTNVWLCPSSCYMIWCSHVDNHDFKAHDPVYNTDQGSNIHVRQGCLPKCSLGLQKRIQYNRLCASKYQEWTTITFPHISVQVSKEPSFINLCTGNKNDTIMQLQKLKPHNLNTFTMFGVTTSLAASCWWNDKCKATMLQSQKFTKKSTFLPLNVHSRAVVTCVKWSLSPLWLCRCFLR